MAHPLLAALLESMTTRTPILIVPHTFKCIDTGTRSFISGIVNHIGAESGSGLTYNVTTTTGTWFIRLNDIPASPLTPTLVFNTDTITP